MIAVSSFKPLAKSPEIAVNQIAAKSSWDRVFNAVVYFNSYEPRLTSGRTWFAPCEEWPFISQLVEYASNQQEPVAIINADIIVSPSLRKLQGTMESNNVSGVVSRRYEFEPPSDPFSTGNIVDLGLDCFIATPWVWKQAVRVVPKEFRIGHCMWDTWMLGFLGKHSAVVDVTPLRLIFHPKHGMREQPHQIPGSTIASGIGYMPPWPRRQLTALS